MNRATRFMAVAACASLWSSTASAQSSDKDADADRLFREGQKLLQEHRYGEACPKFEAAYSKDHQLGTLLNLAYCHKEQGAIWVAWTEFKEAELLATDLKRTDRRDFARQRMAELEKSLARAVVDRPVKVELSEVLVDDRRVPDAEHGSAFAIEPGQRKFTFRAKGKKEVKQMVTVAEGHRAQHIAAPPMDEDEAPPTVSSPAEPVAPPPPPPVDTRPPGSTQRVIGVTLGVAGLVGIGVGVVTGISALSNACASGGTGDPQECPGVPKTSGTFTEANRNDLLRHNQPIIDRGGSMATISTVSFIAGGALLAGGVVLWLTAPRGASTVETGRRIVPELGAGWAGVHGVF